MELIAVFKRNPLVLPLACIAAAAALLISEGSYWRAADQLTELGVVGTARTAIQGLTQSILNAETGQRGYLLTDRKEYLQPYQKALLEIDASFKFLRNYYADDPNTLAQLTRLQALTETKLGELAVTVQAHDEGRREAATDLLLTDIGKETMESIRTLSAELLAHETLNFTRSQADIRRTLMLSRIGMAALSAISLLALFLYLRHNAAFERHQRELRRIVQAERDRLETEVQHRTAQLTELTYHLQTAREDERNRLARNLHDELGALLTSAKLDAARVKSRLNAASPEALERLNHLVETLNSSIALGRRIIEDLRPSTLSNLGLVATLEILARDFATQSGIDVQCTLEPVRLEANSELVVYRVVQEAITNITKYAKAQHVRLRLAPSAERVEVEVHDDGVGFDTHAATRAGYGLMGMRFRVESVGGQLTVDSAPGNGTRVRAVLPQTPRAGVSATSYEG